MAVNVIRVGSVEIMALCDGSLEFDLCNFFPAIPEENCSRTRCTFATTGCASTSAPT
jgi:hypothetical protein